MKKYYNSKAENIPLNIIYEDENLFVINKDKNMVVHPAAGNWSGTILNAILFHFPKNKSLPRCGIVHRLDKDTTGLMVVAKDEITQSNLIKQLQSKKVFREYRAIVWGQVLVNKSIDLPIGRHPSVRTKMAINKNNGKNAVTHYEVLERFIMHSYLRCKLETGRTHQIRVHMNHNTSPIVGDQTYGLKKIIPTKEISLALKEATINFPRQALHSSSLGLIHPKTKEHMRWDIDLPQDMKNLLDLIRHESSIST
jgi:23S rRNA pseudouridine1911/1915/1917 synthase